MSELRWDPFLQEWTVIAAHRGDRPVLAEKSDKSYQCPFCPDAPEGAGDWVVKYTYNKFAALTLDAILSPEDIIDDPAYKIQPGVGVNEVILYTQDHNATLGRLPVDHIAQLVDLWAERYEEYSHNEQLKYVFIFENRGAVIGVSLSHPHGQLYGLPFIPPKFQRQLDGAKAFYDSEGRCLYCEVLERELAAGVRVFAENNDFVAFCPPYAKWDYEAHIYARRHVPSIIPLTPEERRNFAAITKEVVQKFDNLHPNLEFMPYMLGLYQQPTDGQEYPYFHFHVEIYPAMRGADKQKFAGSMESHMGVWINSSAPENVAQMLRDVQVDLE